MKLPLIDQLDLTGISCDIDEMGNIAVWIEDASELLGRRLAGAWYVATGELVDNRIGGSEPWTHDVALRVLV